MKQSDDNKPIPMTSISGGKERTVKEDILYYTDQIVNLIFIGKPGSGKWVLIDAGMPKAGSNIIEVAEKRYGKGSRPEAIILTHGHFDHVGGIVELINKWRVPVYAHPAEFPFLTGKQDYPEPDPSVQGGMLAKLSSLYPHQAIDITGVLQPLPPDHSVPDLPGWTWVHTPGHSPGHVSFFRESDKVLLSGDAVITVRQDSMYKVLLQKEEVNGPPRYLTTDWKMAFESVKKLQALNPLLVIPGHGSAMEGEELRTGLNQLVEEFQDRAVPEYGRYIDEEDNNMN